MVSSIMKLMKSLFGGIVLLFIILGMAVWGTENVFSANLGGSIVSAGKRTLPQDTFDSRVETVIRNYNQSRDKPLSKAEAAKQGIIDQVFAIEQSKTISMGFADKIGALASDEAVIETLEGQEAFANPLTGKFDRTTYLDVLYRNRLTPKLYQEQIRDELTLQSMRQAATGGIYSPDLLKSLQATLIGEERDVSFFTVTSNAAPPPPEATDEALQKYYTENIERFKEPERRAVDLVKVSIDDFTSRVSVTPEEITKVYEATKLQNHSGPETRSWIEMTFETEAAAKTAFGLLAGGKTIEDLAGIVTSMEDSGQATGLSDTWLRDNLFAQNREIGGVVPPRENPDGSYAIWQISNIIPGAVQPLAMVQDQIERRLLQERASVIYYEAIEDLDRAVGAGLSLNEAAREVGVPVISFLPVDQNGMSANGDVFRTLREADEAFRSIFDYNKGEIGDRFDTDSAVYLATATKVEAERTPPLDEVKDDVALAYERSTLSKTLSDYADGLLDKVKSGEMSFADAAKEAGTQVETLPQAITRNTATRSGLPNAVIGGVFAGKEGDINLYPSQLGNQALVVRIDKVTRPEGEALDFLKESAASSLTQSLENDLQAALEAEITTQMDAKANLAALEAYKASVSDIQ